MRLAFSAFSSFSSRSIWRTRAHTILKQARDPHWSIWKTSPSRVCHMSTFFAYDLVTANSLTLPVTVVNTNANKYTIAFSPVKIGLCHIHCYSISLVAKHYIKVVVLKKYVHTHHFFVTGGMLELFRLEWLNCFWLGFFPHLQPSLRRTATSWQPPVCLLGAMTSRSTFWTATIAVWSMRVRYSWLMIDLLIDTDWSHAIAEHVQFAVEPITPNAKHTPLKLHWQPSANSCQASLDLLTPSASYSIRVTLNGEAIKGAPFTVSVMSL